MDISGMKKTIAVVALLAVAAAAGIAMAQDQESFGHHEGAETGQRHGAMHGMHGMRGMGGMDGRHSMQRHQFVMQEGIPEKYRDLTNPLTATDSVLADGQRIYATNCSACHGETGQGDGPAGAALDPKPSSLSELARMPMMSSDAYLYWTIAEGGTPVGSAMPPFEAALSPEDIWSVIVYLREGL